MESRDIPDSAVTASSSYNEASVGPTFARLNSEISGGAWCPHSQLDIDMSGSEWIQVNFTSQRFVITAISTQGRFGNGMGVEFVEEYWVEYSRDGGKSWHKWKSQQGSHILSGNTDTYTVKKNRLDLPIVGASVIRIVPFSQHLRTVCLRFELHGCPLKENGPIAYDMIDGVFGGPFGDLIDDSYDGSRNTNGLLSGGLGQLFDGIKGHENYKINSGFEWIGWKAGNDSFDIDFTFPDNRNFTSASFHVHNLFRKSVEVFSTARVYFSFDRVHWSKNPLEFEYMPDHMIETPREVVIHLHHKIAKYVRFSLKFASKWLLISEVSFDASSLPADYVENPQDLESPHLPKKLFKPRLSSRSSSVHSILIFVGIGILAITISGVAIVVGYRFWVRRRRKKEPNNFYSVDVDFISGIPSAFISSDTSTPVYIEPHQYGDYRVRRKVPNGTTNLLTESLNPSDHEYAVPDIVYKDNGTGLTSRLIANPLQEASDSLERGRTSSLSSSSQRNNTNSNNHQHIAYRTATLADHHRNIKQHPYLYNKTYVFDTLIDRNVSIDRRLNKM